MVLVDNDNNTVVPAERELFGLYTETLENTLRAIAGTLQARRWTMSTAESCTGGMIAASCTDLAGSSQWFDRGFITYSNAAKTDLLGVPALLILRHGAVSDVVARAMAVGAIVRSQSQVSIAVTGVAGPGGGTAEKPVGTVWIAWQVDGVLHSEVQQFSGDRTAIRHTTVHYALTRLRGLLDGENT